MTNWIRGRPLTLATQGWDIVVPSAKRTWRINAAREGVGRGVEVRSFELERSGGRQVGAVDDNRAAVVERGEVDDDADIVGFRAAGDIEVTGVAGAGTQCHVAVGEGRVGLAGVEAAAAVGVDIDRQVGRPDDIGRRVGDRQHEIGSGHTAIAVIRRDRDGVGAADGGIVGEGAGDHAGVRIDADASRQTARRECQRVAFHVRKCGAGVVRERCRIDAGLIDQARGGRRVIGAGDGDGQGRRWRCRRCRRRSCS